MKSTNRPSAHQPAVKSPGKTPVARKGGQQNPAAPRPQPAGTGTAPVAPDRPGGRKLVPEQPAPAGKSKSKHPAKPRGQGRKQRHGRGDR